MNGVTRRAWSRCWRSCLRSAGSPGLSRRAVASFAGAAAVAGLGGLLAPPNVSAHYLMGVPLAIQGFTALVIGGVGRVEGALLGGLLLAFAEQFTARYAPIPGGFVQG